jgi:hypothetical protein
MARDMFNNDHESAVRDQPIKTGAKGERF